MKKIIIILTAIILLIGGKTMAQNTLTQKEQNITMISAYTASGNQEELKKSLNKALDEGLTVNEIKEVLVQMYAYCGFPKSLNGINTFMNIVDSRKNLTEGEVGKPLSKDINKREYGNNVQIELTGAPVTGKTFEFAPAIDSFLKEHLFADIFARGVLTYQEREIATIAALSTIADAKPQLNSHIKIGKHIGLTDAQIEEILKLTSTINKGGEFGLGNENTAYAKYFIGQSYLNPLTNKNLNIANVTFEPGCRNNWHIHHKGGQILLVTSGRGYYQEWGKPAQELKPGDVVNIPAEIKHWHGAAKDSWFSHIAIEVPSEGSSNEWLEEVSAQEYNKLK